MPCRYDESPQEIQQRQALRDAEQRRQVEKKYIEPLDKLTRENDALREEILRIVEENPMVKISPKVLTVVTVSQANHRKEDLARLKKVFTKSKDAARLGAVMLADPKKPLAPQLGFDPDEF